MAIVRVSDSGINGGKFRNAATDKEGYASIDEAASTNASWDILLNPIGDGRNFRSGVWLVSGTLVVRESGVIDVMLVGGGGGGFSNNPGWCGAGRSGAPIARTRQLYLNAGTYAITVGAGGATLGATGGSSTISGPSLQENWQSFSSGDGNTGPSMQDTSSRIIFDHTGGANRSAESSGTGTNGGGQGGAATAFAGGPALTVSGWSPAPLDLGAGGRANVGSVARDANSGDGGHGGCSGAWGTGGSGRVHIRYQI